MYLNPTEMHVTAAGILAKFLESLAPLARIAHACFIHILEAFAEVVTKAEILNGLALAECVVASAPLFLLETAMGKTSEILAKLISHCGVGHSQELKSQVSLVAGLIALHEVLESAAALRPGPLGQLAAETGLALKFFKGYDKLVASKATFSEDTLAKLDPICTALGPWKASVSARLLDPLKTEFFSRVFAHQHLQDHVFCLCSNALRMLFYKLTTITRPIVVYHEENNSGR